MSETNFETNETGATAAQRVEDANVNDDSSNPSSPSPSLSSASSTSSEEKMEIAHAPSSPLAMNNEQQQPQLSAQPQAAPSQQQQQHQQVAPQSPQHQVQHQQQQQQLHHQQQQQQQQQHQSAPANAGSGMQQYCVSWNSYASHLQGAFPKLLSSEQFVDVSLACDGGSFKCHKVVLSACSEYMERILLDLPCQHPVIFMTNMEYWELQALIQFMYHGEVYVEEAKLRQLLKAADALQIRGLSGKNTDLNGAKDEHNTHNNIHQQHAHHSTPKVPTSNAASTPSASNASSTAGDFPQADDNSADGSDCDLHNIIPTLPAGTTAVPTSENLSYDTEPIQEDMHHSYDMSLAGGSCETSVVEGPGTVKLEPDDHHHNMMGYNDKNNYSVNMVPVNASCQPSSPFPAIEGNDFVGPRHKNIQNGQNGHNLSYQKRQRRSEAELKLAADLVSRGMTFQVASEQYSIPISTIRFYMARKGILQRRKRGRGSNTNVNNSAMMSSNNIMNNQPNSPTGNPPFHMMNYRLPESLNSSLQ